MKNLTEQRFRAIINQAKAFYTFFPEYKIDYEIWRNRATVSSNTLEVLEYIQRHAGGVFQQDGKLLIKLEE